MLHSHAVMQDMADLWRYVASCRLADGGYFFARVMPSSLRDTYFALKCFRLGGQQPPQPEETVRFLLDRYQNEPPASIYGNYLSQLERRGPYLYIERAYWLTSAFAYLGAKPRYPYRLAAFVRACQRPNGGFTRAAAIGITTLEYTYYALATLEALQVENITRYIDPMDGHPYNSSNQ